MGMLDRLSGKSTWRLLTAVASVAVVAPSFGQTSSTATPDQGLSLTYSAEKASDVVTAPNVWLYVQNGKSPTPFLPGDKFNAVWDGSLTVDKRANYTFQAELNGALKLELNGQVVLDVTTNGVTEISQPVQLKKGANVLKAQFTSPSQGDAFVRLNWQPKDSFMQPIPIEALKVSAETPESKQATKLHQGRELFLEFRCAKCHAGPTKDAIPELSMDAPSFDGIGSRRNYDWMARWIQDPKSLRPTAHMPQVLHGAKAKEDAESIAAYLASLKDETVKPSTAEPTADQIGAGEKLFESLHCAACHNPPGGSEADDKKIYLKQVQAKFASGTLAAFLLKPDAHYAWIRMPNFKLSQDEANQLTAFLTSKADKPNDAKASSDAAILERGKKLVQTAGCLSCHTSKLENQFSTTALAQLTADKWKQGCLAEKPDDASKSPHFSFTTEEREALQAFAASDRSSLERHLPTEFADRQTKLLNCRECHGKFEGFPQFDILGGKLKPEWSKAFISGELAVKPRPWLEARMPAFNQRERAEGIAKGLAMNHGYAPETPAEPPIDMEMAKVGQKLVSSAGGFSCVSCHAIGQVGATQVFESAGINLALTGARLMKPYLHRWVRNPQLIDPNTKMPVYFDEEGKSPLADVYGGDAVKQIEAIRQYIRQGDKMPPPPTP